jgi:hypothetical protein
MQRVRRDLERWRRTRTYVRAPIPSRIWAGAVALARHEGLYQTARALPIHYGALKQHLAAGDPGASAGARSRFVELRPMAPPTCDACVLELEGPRSLVRVRLPRVGLPELAHLSRLIAGVEP